MAVLQLLTLFNMMGEIIGHDGCMWKMCLMKNGKLDCSSQKLRCIPILPSNFESNVTEVDYRNNSIAEIPPYHFENVSETLQILDVSYNLISVLNKDSFRGLRQLDMLKLGHNRLCLHSAYPEGLFKDLVNLQILFTLGNKCNGHTRGHQSYSDGTFADLVSLQKISLDVASNFTLGVGFTNLTNLISFEASGYDQMMTVAITNSSFASLSSIPITDLILRGGSFSAIQAEALQHFQNLRTLNVACSGLGQFVMESIHGMTRPSLETVIFDGTYVFRDFQTSHDNLFCHQNFYNVKRLSYRYNWFSNSSRYLLKEALQKCLPRLEQLNIGILAFDKFAVCNRFLQHIFDCDPNPHTVYSPSDFYTTQPLRIVELYGEDQLYTVKMSLGFCKDTEQDIADYFHEDPSVISLESWPYQGVYKIPETLLNSANLLNSTIIKFDLSPSIASLSATGHFAEGHSFASLLSCPWIYFPFNTLVHLNISHNDFGELPCEILGMEKLKVFDCSGCNLENISPELCNKKHLPNIESLYLADNRLNRLLEKGISPFNELTTLKEIYVPNNKIQELPFNFLKNLYKLEKLDLSHNQMRDLDLDISQNQNLKLVDVSWNQLPHFSSKMMTAMEKLHKITPDFQLKIYGNPFECSCGSIAFLRWIQSTKVDIADRYTILCPEQETQLLEVDIPILEASCDKTTKYVTIISCLTVFSLLAILCGIVVYHYRWKIAWHVFIMRRRFNLCHKPPLREPEYELQTNEFDAFVAYATEDDVGRRWMRYILLPHVEDHLHKRLHVFDRDSFAGNYRIAELIDGMKHSKHTIFILTDDFLRFYEWEMVLYWAARRGLDSIILCCIGGFKLESMPAALGKVALEIQEKHPTHYLEFPIDQPIDNADSSFDSIL